ncbi:hypothetical protein [Streptomyces sp. NPDC005209]|uniref:hypothetical protein n=1 Tax=Streptomyces sp. NPDC005209 TaxID=3156715 RepID=UPI0033AD5B28
MNLTLKRLLGATVAVATGATVLLGTGAGTANAVSRAHCDRAERSMWNSGPGTDVIGHNCSMPDTKRRWYRIEIDTLVQTHYKNEYVDGGVARTVTVHDRSVRCLGYTSNKGTVHWFGCPPS